MKRGGAVTIQPSEAQLVRSKHGKGRLGLARRWHACRRFGDGPGLRRVPIVPPASLGCRVAGSRENQAFCTILGWLPVSHKWQRCQGLPGCGPEHATLVSIQPAEAAGPPVGARRAGGGWERRFQAKELPAIDQRFHGLPPFPATSPGCGATPLLDSCLLF